MKCGGDYCSGADTPGVSEYGEIRLRLWGEWGRRRKSDTPDLRALWASMIYPLSPGLDLPAPRRHGARGARGARKPKTTPATITRFPTGRHRIGRHLSANTPRSPTTWYPKYDPAATCSPRSPSSTGTKHTPSPIQMGESPNQISCECTHVRPASR